MLRKACDDLGIGIWFTPRERKVVKAFTGHSTDRMFEHYSHVDIDEKRAATDSVVQLVREK